MGNFFILELIMNEVSRSLRNIFFSFIHSFIRSWVGRLGRGLRLECTRKSGLGLSHFFVFFSFISSLFLFFSFSLFPFSSFLFFSSFFSLFFFYFMFFLEGGEEAWGHKKVGGRPFSLFSCSFFFFFLSFFLVSCFLLFFPLFFFFRSLFSFFPQKVCVFSRVPQWVTFFAPFWSSAYWKVI